MLAAERASQGGSNVSPGTITIGSGGFQPSGILGNIGQTINDAQKLIDLTGGAGAATGNIQTPIDGFKLPSIFGG